MADAEDESQPLLSSGNHRASLAEPSCGRDLEGTEHDGLARHMGFASVALLISNRIIGTGIFATPALILQSAGSVGSSLLLWLVGACIAGAGTAVYVEFGTGIPKSGGEKNYLTFLYPRPAYLVPSAYAAYATLMGWAAGNSIICGEYILHALGVPVNSWNQRLIGAVCLTAATALHGTSLRWGLRVQNGFATFKLVVLATIGLAGLAVLIGALKLDGDALDNFKDPFRGSNTSVNALATGLYKVIWSFIGYANANAALSEVKNPVQTIRRAAPLAITTVAALYIAVNLAYFAVVPKEEMMEGGTVVAWVWVWASAERSALSQPASALSFFDTCWAILRSAFSACALRYLPSVLSFPCSSRMDASTRRMPGTVSFPSQMQLRRQVRSAPP